MSWGKAGEGIQMQRAERRSAWSSARPKQKPIEAGKPTEAIGAKLMHSQRQATDEACVKPMELMQR